MLFTSFIFWIFFLIVLLAIQANYKIFNSVKIQNFLLLIASYIFYGYWDWRFLILIIIVSIQTFLFGNLIKKSQSNQGKIYLIISIVINLFILGYFKYANFFVTEFLRLFNLQESLIFSNIVLPVGISFYIFQSLTYVVDIFLKKLVPEKEIVNYLTYIAFFPQLVAGPIERASSLLPQFRRLHRVTLENLYLGIKLIIVGLFLKVFIADNIGVGVDKIFANYENYKSGTLFLGALGFSIQIYGDFCGYSSIAIGVAKIMDFNLMQNFKTPYFSNSLQEFWSRWHISLSTFLNDYIFMPLALMFRRKGKIGIESATIITFIISGFWHGANWTFFLWGILNGIILVIQKSFPKSIKNNFGSITTLFFLLILWILFRSESIIDFSKYIYLLFTTKLQYPEMGYSIIVYSFYYFILDLILFKFSQKEETWFSSKFLESFLLSIMFLLALGSISKNVNFIYFQF